MKLIRYILLCVGFVISCFWISSCKKDDINHDASLASPAHMSVKMTDAPGDYDEVNIQIIDIQVSAEGNDSVWASIAGVKPGIYNLLELSNGVQTIIADGDLSARKIKQIRLILGTENTIKVNGQVYALKTPSAEQSGLKLNLNTELTAGSTMDVLIDFDAAKSIVETGAGTYILKPVIKVVEVKTMGSVSGTIQPGQVALISASQSLDASYTYSDQNGRFVMNGLAVGAYTITVTPKFGSGYNPKVIADVRVAAGQNTNLGPITLGQD